MGYAGRSLSYLHVLRAALEGRGYRRGYLDGALTAGVISHALARDVGGGRRGAGGSPAP